jgi:hypothetical protein
MQTIKKSDGTVLSGLAVAQKNGNQYIFQFTKDGHTCEDLQTAFSNNADNLVISTDGKDGTPIEGYGKLVKVELIDDRISVTMRQPTAKEKLQAAVEAGTITADQYKAITGEDYPATT